MPAYPAPMSMLAQPVTGPASWNQNKVTAAVLSFVAAVVAVAGSFVPLFSGRLDFSGEAIEMTFTAWSVDVTGGGPVIGDPGLGGVPKFGYPLVFAGIALLCAAAVASFAALPAASPGTHRLAGGTTAVGAAFLLGTVWSVAMQAVSWVDSFGSLGENELGIDSSASYEAGHWLLLGAVALGLAAAVLALLPPRRPRPAPDQPTPPYGFAMPHPGAPVAYALPTVDPLTGQPAGPPAPVDPRTGLPMSPYTGPTPAAPLDPNLGARAVDPNTGLPVGQPNPAPLVPTAGPAPVAPSDPVVVDPNTGRPTEDPPAEPGPRT